MTFHIWKPLPQGKKGQACLGQECAGGARLGYLMGGESLCAGHWVLLLAPVLTRQSMGAPRMSPTSQSPCAQAETPGPWLSLSWAPPWLGRAAGTLEASQSLEESIGGCPSLCINHGSHESREVEEGILFNTGTLGELERAGILNTTPPPRSLLGGLL